MVFIGRLLVCLVVTSAGRHVLTAGQQPPSRAAQKQSADEPVAVPMELLANRPLVRVKVNGRGPFAFLVAPEAPATLIDPSLVSELKLKAEGDRNAAPQFELQMEFGTSKVNVKATASDMAAIVPEFPPPVRPRGVISASPWPSHLVTLNYLQSQIAVEPGSLPDPNRRDIFSLKSEASDLGVTLSVASVAIACRLEPLFPGGLLLPETYASSLPLAGKRVEMGSTVTTRGREVVREGELGAMTTLGMFELARPFVQFANSAERCTIGGQRLSGFSITYDLTNARVRLAHPRPR
jgi:hypothetical protein